MPKKNVYVPEDMAEWMAEHPEFPYSRLFQEQVKKAMAGEDVEPENVVRVRRVRVRGNEVLLRNGERIAALEGTKERLIAVVTSDG